MRLAYADPPYPGMAGLYPEKAEVDHVELIAKLREYDGWALSTDERSLSYVLSLCPTGVRILAWCRRNPPPHRPQPCAAWEPVLLQPARTNGAVVKSYCETLVPSGRGAKRRFVGQKPAEFCEWVIRCLGAAPGDTLYDLFPGTGAMSEAWKKWEQQPTLPVARRTRRGGAPHWNEIRRWNSPIDGMDSVRPIPERRKAWETK